MSILEKIFALKMDYLKNTGRDPKILYMGKKMWMLAYKEVLKISQKKEILTTLYRCLSPEHAKICEMDVVLTIQDDYLAIA